LVGIEHIKLTLSYKTQTYRLDEGDERPSQEQRADPISSQEYQFEFSKGQIAAGESFDVCVEGPGGYSDCKR
jgi:hypothetical protein